MRQYSLELHPDSGNHWAVGIGGMTKEIATIVKQKGGFVPTDGKGNTQFVLIQLGEDREFGVLTHEQIRLKFTIQEAKWLIGEIEDVLWRIESDTSEVSFALPPASPVTLSPPDFSKISLDIPN